MEGAKEQAAFAAWALRGAPPGALDQSAVLLTRNGSMCVYDIGTFASYPYRRHAVYDTRTHTVAFIGADHGTIVRITDAARMEEHPSEIPLVPPPTTDKTSTMFARKPTLGNNEYVTARPGQEFYVVGTCVVRNECAFVPVVARFPVYPGQSFGLLPVRALAETAPSKSAPLSLHPYDNAVSFANTPWVTLLNVPLLDGDNGRDAMTQRYTVTDDVDALSALATWFWEKQYALEPAYAFTVMSRAVRIWQYLWTEYEIPTPVLHAVQKTQDAYHEFYNDDVQSTSFFSTDFIGYPEPSGDMSVLSFVNEVPFDIVDEDGDNLADHFPFFDVLDPPLYDTVHLNRYTAVATMHRLRHLPQQSLNSAAYVFVPDSDQVFPSAPSNLYIRQRHDNIFEVGASDGPTDGNNRSPKVDGTATNVVKVTDGHLLFGYCPVNAHSDPSVVAYSTAIKMPKRAACTPLVKENDEGFTAGMWYGDAITDGDTEGSVTVTRRCVQPDNTINLTDVHTETTADGTTVVTNGEHAGRAVLWVNGVHNPAFKTPLRFAEATILLEDFQRMPEGYEPPPDQTAALGSLLMHNADATMTKVRDNDYRRGTRQGINCFYSEDVGSLLCSLSDCNVVMWTQFTVKILGLPSLAEAKGQQAVLEAHWTADLHKSIDPDEWDWQTEYFDKSSKSVSYIHVICKTERAKAVTSWWNAIYEAYAAEPIIPGATMLMPPPMIPCDKVVAINGLKLTDSIANRNTGQNETLVGLGGWVSFTRFNTGLADLNHTSTMYTNTSMFLHKSVYYNVGPQKTKDLDDNAVAATRVMVAEEPVEPPTVYSQLKQPETDVLVLIDSRGHNPDSTHVLMDWDDLLTDTARVNFLVNLLPKHGKTLSIYTEDVWYQNNAPYTVFNTVAEAVGKSTLVLYIVARSYVVYGRPPACLKYVDERSHPPVMEFPAITVVRASTHPLPDSSPIPAYSRSPQVVRQLRSIIRTLGTQCDSSSEFQRKFGFPDTFTPNKTVDEAITAHIFNLAVEQPRHPCIHQLVWAKPPKDSGLEQLEWAPAYTLDPAAKLQFAEGEAVVYSEKTDQSLRSDYIIDKLRSADADQAWKIDPKFETVRPLSDFNITAQGLESKEKKTEARVWDGVLFPTNLLPSQCTALMQLMTTDATAKTIPGPFIVAPRPIASQFGKDKKEFEDLRQVQAASNIAFLAGVHVDGVVTSIKNGKYTWFRKHQSTRQNPLHTQSGVLPFETDEEIVVERQRVDIEGQTKLIMYLPSERTLTGNACNTTALDRYPTHTHVLAVNNLAVWPTGGVTQKGQTELVFPSGGSLLLTHPPTTHH